jgi:hypothetical protein
MEVFLFLMVVFGAGFVLGKFHAYWNFARLMREIAESNGIDFEKELRKLSDEEEEPEKLVYKLMVETHGDLLYLFDKDTDEFICQGASVQELATIALERKKINLAAVLHDNKIFQFKDGVSTEVV